MQQHKREVRDGMRIDWDIPIEMDDGTALRADVFRPVDDGRYPVIMTHGPYAKGEWEKLGEVVLSWGSVPAGEVQGDDVDPRRSAALDPACQHRPTGQPCS
jgi:hypothetical protein